MQRKTVYPKGHFGLQVEIPYSMGVQHGALFALCGQTDLNSEGLVGHPSDLLAQTQASVQNIKVVVEALGASMEDLTKLVVFYVPNSTLSEAQFAAFLADQLNTLNRPVVTFVPLPALFYEQLEIEIDAYGVMLNDSTKRQEIKLPHFGGYPQYADLVRVGELIFAGGISAIDQHGQTLHPDDAIAQSHLVQDRVTELLQQINADKQDIVKINNWFVESGDAEQWAQCAQVRADYYPEPGPVATGLPVVNLQREGLLIRTDFWAMLGEDGSRLPKQHAWPEGHWDWPIHLPFKHGLKCGDFMFVGGQVEVPPT